MFALSDRLIYLHFGNEWYVYTFRHNHIFTLSDSIMYSSHFQTELYVYTPRQTHACIFILSDSYVYTFTHTHIYTSGSTNIFTLSHRLIYLHFQIDSYIYSHFQTDSNIEFFRQNHVLTLQKDFFIWILYHFSKTK